MTNQLRSGVLAVMLLSACGEGTIEDFELEEPMGEVAIDDGTGEEMIADPDPISVRCPLEPCAEEDMPEMDAGEPEPEPELDAGLISIDAGTPDAGQPRDAGTPDAGVNPWSAGAKVLVRGYVSFRTAANSDAGLVTAAQPAGGVTDSAHGGGMTRGVVPPGQAVTLVTGTRTNGYYQVRYAGLTGWISGSWLTPIPTTSRAAFAALPNVRNAFFKNQLHRTRWNKDGPYSSGTCAPTSLAMAIHALGREPATLSVEESIHRVRQSYGATSDSTGTFRSQITTGARALGMSVRVLDTRLTPTDSLTRLDGQLAAGRMVVLEGQSASGSAYHSAFNRAYIAEGLSNRYTFAGRHSIVVIGRDGTGYVVGDPLSEVGMVKLTGAELKTFFATWGGTGNAVW